MTMQEKADCKRKNLPVKPGTPTYNTYKNDPDSMDNNAQLLLEALRCFNNFASYDIGDALVTAVNKGLKELLLEQLSVRTRDEIFLLPANVLISAYLRLRALNDIPTEEYQRGDVVRLSGDIYTNYYPKHGEYITIHDRYREFIIKEVDGDKISVLDTDTFDVFEVSAAYVIPTGKTVKIFEPR